MDVRLFIETKFCRDGRFAVFIVLLAWPRMTLYSWIFSDVRVDLTFLKGFLSFVNGFFAFIIKPDCVVLTNGEFAFEDIIFGYGY